MDSRGKRRGKKGRGRLISDRSIVYAWCDKLLRSGNVKIKKKSIGTRPKTPRLNHISPKHRYQEFIPREGESRGFASPWSCQSPDVKIDPAISEASNEKGGGTLLGRKKKKMSGGRAMNDHDFGGQNAEKSVVCAIQWEKKRWVP